MSNKEWVQEYIHKYGHAEAKTEKAYLQFLRETGSSMSYESYWKRVWEARHEPEFTTGTAPAPEQEVDAKSEQAVTVYDEEYLLSILETEINERQAKVTTADFRDIENRYELTRGAFLQIKDLEKKLKFLYDINVLDINNKISFKKKDEELRILREENRQLLAKHIDIDKVMEAVESAVKEYKPYPRPTPVIPKSRTAYREALLFVSDIHMGETVTLADSAGTNLYNSQIAKQRIDEYFTKAIADVKSLGIGNITLALGGDIVGGIIHEEITRNSDANIVTSMLEIADYLAQWIQTLTKHFSSIRVFCTVGNHGRMLPGKPYYQEYSNLNFDTIVYEFIKKEIKNCVDEFENPEGIYTVFSIAGSRVCLTHGHIFGGGGNGFSTFPNTIPRDTAKLSGILESNFGKINYFIIGHFHTPGIGNSFVQNIPTIINGSVKGPDAFSLGKMKSASRPSQSLLVFEENVGLKYYSNIDLT